MPRGYNIIPGESSIAADDEMGFRGVKRAWWFGTFGGCGSIYSISGDSSANHKPTEHGLVDLSPSCRVPEVG